MKQEHEHLHDILQVASEQLQIGVASMLSCNNDQWSKHAAKHMQNLQHAECCGTTKAEQLQPEACMNRTVSRIAADPDRTVDEEAAHSRGHTQHSGSQALEATRCAPLQLSHSPEMHQAEMVAQVPVPGHQRTP